MSQHALKATVKNGRLVLDEPIDLPDGTEVELQLADEGDELDDEERKRLHQALAQGIRSLRAGRGKDADEVVNRLLSRS